MEERSMTHRQEIIAGIRVIPESKYPPAAMKRAKIYALVSLVLLACAALQPLPIMAQAPLVQSSDLQYLGAFRLPPGAFGGTSGGFDYGGTAMTYNANNNSLFIVGHDWDQMVAEAKIPTIVNSTNLSSLNTATVLQQFKDPSEGKIYTVGSSTVKVGGLLVYQNKLYGSAYVYYDAMGSQTLSHYYKSTLTLATTGTAKGMYAVGNIGAGYVSGYMTPVPSEWQSALGGTAVTGNCCLSIISRTSSGPALSAFYPEDLGVKSPVPATPLVYYPLSNPLAVETTQNSLFNLCTEIKGVVFPGGTRSVLFVGRHDTGSYCYGTGGASGGDCYDPANSSKGPHFYPYVYQIWAYDVNDLVSVKNGQKQPWQLRPYATWTLTLPFADSFRRVGGAAWDPSTRRMYILTQYSDGAQPVVHAYQINVGSSSSVPSAPANLRIVP
jgi:hypothetical protein